MKVDLLIVGCGYVGTAVGEYYAREGWSVAGLIRSEKRKEELEQKNITPIIADLALPETLTQIPEAKYILICPSAGKREAARYQEVYVDGVRNYLNVLSKQAPPEKLIYISSTGIYSQNEGEQIDETTNPNPVTERSQLLLQAEQQILDSTYSSIIFRLSGIYGPGRNRIKTLQTEPIINLENKPKWMNLIYIDDIVQAIGLLFEKGSAGEIYLGVDDEPMDTRDFYSWLILKLKIQPDVTFRENNSLGKKCSNKKLKELGFKPKYPSFRQGYQRILEIE